MDRKDSAHGDDANAKKIYQAPQLKMYGSLTELTNATMTGGSSDGAGKGMSGS